MTARSTRATNREHLGVAMTTTEAQIHAADEIEPVHSPAQSPAQQRGKGSNRGRKKQSNANKRVTVSDLSQTVSAMQQSADRQEARVERVEGRMDGMDAKLDFIVSALGKDNSSKQPVNNISVSQSPARSVQVMDGRTPSISQATPRNYGPQHDSAPVLDPLCPLPAPAVLVAEQNAEGGLDRMMSRQNFKPSENKGKRVSYGESGMPKPYMFLEREGLQTNRQKLDVRCSITSEEYMYCVLALLHEKDSSQPDDREHILAHVFAVATDILTRPWPAVRRWTQSVWDSVEKGRCRWNDYRFIQDERVRLSYMSAPPMAGPGSSTGPRSGPSAPGSEVKIVVCPDFNSPHGCSFSSSHDDGKIRYAHACAHCNALGRRSAHSFQRCRTRIEAQAFGAGQQAQPAPQHENRNWNQPQARATTGQGAGFGYNNRQSHSYNQSQAKNGY